MAVISCKGLINHLIGEILFAQKYSLLQVRDLLDLLSTQKDNSNADELLTFFLLLLFLQPHLLLLIGRIAHTIVI